MKKKKILYLKCVAISEMNKITKEYLEQYVDENTELEVRNIGVGAKHMEFRFYQAINQMEILREVLHAEKEGFDACALSCFYDPCLLEAREITRRIVITAPAEASMHLAATLGDKFSIIVGRKKWIPQMRENVKKYGFESKLASFRSLDLGVLDFHDNENQTLEKMKQEVRQAIEEDGADVIILGCTMQFGFYKELQKEFGVPVIDSMIAVTKYAEYLTEMKRKVGLEVSRKSTYQRPSDEEMKNWGLEKDFGFDNLLYDNE